MLYNITPFYSMQFCSHWCIFYTSPNKVYYYYYYYYYYQACKYTFFLFLINKIYCQYILSCDILSFQTNNSFKYEKNFYRITSVGFLSSIFKVLHFLTVWVGSEQFHVRIWRTKLSSKCPVRSNSKFVLLYFGSLQHQ